MRFFTWFAGFFSDKEGDGSRKAIGLYILLFFKYLLVMGSLEGKPIDTNIVLGVDALLFWLFGAITSEFFQKIFLKKKEDENSKKETA